MPQVVEAPNSVTVRSAREFIAGVQDVCASGEDVLMDCTALGEVDLSFLQIVIAARAQLEDAGASLRLAAPAGEALTALLDRAGFLTALTPADLDFWFHGERPQ
ncbi:MAG: STAS domain-containing protein [Novosphingobium sp.]|nr:STAS domain-containing protein [Novosphingobium sp.]